MNNGLQFNTKKPFRGEIRVSEADISERRGRRRRPRSELVYYYIYYYKKLYEKVDPAIPRTLRRFQSLNTNALGMQYGLYTQIFQYRFV